MCIRDRLKLLHRCGRSAAFETARALGALAGVRQRQGRQAEAEKLYQAAVEAMEKAQAGEHPETAALCAELGSLLAAQQRPDAAERWLQRAARIAEQQLDAGHPHRQRLIEGYARLLRATGRGAQAAVIEARASRGRQTSAETA